MQGSAAGVADAEGLRGGVAAALGGREGEAGRTGTDGGRHGGRGNGIGHWHCHTRGARGSDRDHSVIGASCQSGGSHSGGHGSSFGSRCWTN